VLQNRGPLPQSEGIKATYCYENALDSTVHANVIWTFAALRERGIEHPSIAVLCRSNPFVARLSGALLTEHRYNGRTLPPVSHDVAWDADLSACAGEVIGSVLEWPVGGAQDATLCTLRLIGRYFRLKSAVSEKPVKSAQTRARQFEQAAEAVLAGRQPRIKAARDVVQAAGRLSAWCGSPVSDWLRARSALDSIEALKEIGVASRMIRLFRASDAIAAGLSAIWVYAGSYQGAATFVRRTLERERLTSAERESRGCQVMTMHKSKGKEFDAVVLVEGKYRAPFFSPRERHPHEGSRRLLRMAITRARYGVVIIRPHGASELVD